MKKKKIERKGEEKIEKRNKFLFFRRLAQTDKNKEEFENKTEKIDQNRI